MKKLAGIALFIAFVLQTNACAQTVVTVLPAYRAIYYSATLKLRPGESIPIDLPANEAGDSYVLLTEAQATGLALIVIDGRDRASNNLAPVPLLDTMLHNGVWTAIPKPPSREGSIAVLVNRSALALTAAVRADRIGVRSPQARSRIRDLVALSFDALNIVYDLPPISVTVQPCGQINAFSGPDITVCSELISDLFERKLINALHPILLHELAHSVLQIWNLPGYDNEDMADEFAAIFLAKFSPDILQDYIRWLQSKDSVAEAIIQLTAGGRHSLSIQRARNMQRIIDDPDRVMRRWNTLLSPHVRR